ncbi:HAD family hydrolase [Myxococcota bacterium]|nr:HAD family hydrolase [Myxococcota bacterium]
MTTHILFDFFGTLTSYSASRTDQGYAKTFRLLRENGASLGYEEFLSRWSEVAAEFDEAAERTHREFSMTDLAAAFLGRIFPVPRETLVREFVEMYLSEWNKGVRYLLDVPPLIHGLSQRFELAVITNTHDRDLVPNHLARMGISQAFGRVFTSVELGFRKPSPRIFEHALDVLAVSPDRCVYVGDNYAADYLGARGVGMRALLIDPSGSAPVPDADRLRSIVELEGALGPEGRFVARG